MNALLNRLEKEKAARQQMIKSVVQTQKEQMAAKRE